jgi:hypothetical protein
MILENINTRVLSTDRTSRQKINKDILELNNTMGEIDLRNIYRKFYPIVADCTFYSIACGHFSKIDHIMVYKASLHTYKRNRNRAEGMVQVVDHLLSKCKALSSNPSTENNLK